MPLTLTRSLLAIILPGFIACAPFFLLVALSSPIVEAFYEKHAVLGNTVAFGIAVLVGSIIEEFGSYIEKRWDDSIQNLQTDAGSWVHTEWLKYLAREFPSGEPV